MTARVRRHALLLGATLIALVVHVVAAARIGGPSVSFDETGYLGTARWLAGSGGTWEMPTAPAYGVGYPLLIAPVLRVASDPTTAWWGVLAVNALLLTALVPLIYLVTRRLLGASRPTAVAAGLVGGLAPAVVAAGVSAIAENLVLPLVAGLVLATDRALRPGRPLSRLAVGPVAAALATTHSRFLPALLVTVALLGTGWARRALPPVVAAANLGLLVLLTGAGRVLASAAERARWDHVERLEGGTAELRDLATTGQGWGELLTTAIGQLWYLVIGSAGLAVVGVAAWVAVARGRSTPATDTGGVGSAAVGARWAAAHLLGVAATVFSASVVFFAHNQFRADHFIYGRHNDSFTPLWLAAAIVVVVEARRRTVARLLALAGGVGLAASVGLVLLRDAGDHGGRYSAFAVPAVIRFVAHDPPGLFWRASLAALAALAVIAILVLVVRRPRLVAPLLCVAFTWAGFGTVAATESFSSTIYDGLDAPALVQRLDIDALAIDVTAAEVAYPALTYPFLLPGVDVTTFDPRDGEGPAADAVLARADSTEWPADGARIAALDRSGYTEFWSAPGGLAVWIRPGAEQDRLAAEGALLPTGWPAALPESARRVELRAIGLPDDRTVTAAPGGRAEVVVRGRHAGTGSPWPDVASDATASRVRLIAMIEAIDPGGPPGARSGGELPAWLLPGDPFSTTVEVIAVDQVLGPLPPGRYRVVLGVGQDAEGWVATGGDDATFTLVVRDG